MTDHLLHSRKYFASFFCFLFFVVSLLTFPVQTIAQTRSSQRERRVQIFFAYNPTRPAAGQEIQFQDFSRGNPSSWLWDFGDGQTSILQNPRHVFPTPGSYKVILTARNNVSSGRVSRTLNVILSISASFTYGPANPVTGQAVQFTDTTTGGPTSWLWNFGDGASSTSQNPSHAYTTAGSYTVTLTVGFSSGSKTVSQAITVASSLAASFIYNPNPPVAGQAVQFTDTSTGSPTSWQWSFGDGATSNSQNPNHTYATAASYTVTLTVVYNSGSKSVSQTITVIPPPALSASFTYSPSSPVAGQAIQFTDTSTGNPTSWLWNFGDNTTSTSKNPSHAFTTAASYTVTLTATNSSASKSASQTINVLPASTLTASFTYSPSSPVAGQVVYFTDTSTGSPTSWQWNLGDGATSTTRNPSHAYTTAASYTVTLTVTNSSGSKSTSQTITVLPTFAASFTYSPSSPAANQAVQFTDTSPGSPTAWQWNFGDNTTSTSQNPSHTYATVGSYWVNLIITKGTDSQSTSQMITVRQPGIITAASPSLTDVKAAISTAGTGDTVLVPAGSAIWNSPLGITKGIILKGAGAGLTIITSNYSNSGDHLITYTPSDFSANNPFRITGFTFDLANKCKGIFLNHWSSSSLVIQTKIRIDHNTFTGAATTYLQAITNGGMRGVVDNNLFDNMCYPIRNSTCYRNGQEWWDNWEAVVFGKADNNIYYEDNIFTGVEIVMDCQYSNRYVVRYNTITTYMESWPLFDMHGNDGVSYSGFGGEIYGNQINSNYATCLLDHRGGKFVVFMNNKNGTEGWGIQVRNEVPSLRKNPTTNPSPQYPNDSYYWLNRRNLTGSFAAASATTTQTEGALTLVPTANREFFDGTDSFNGTLGMGYGTLAARPATCTVGVGYWATDQSVTSLAGMVGKNPTTPISGTLYRCTSTNVWTTYYTPYTYPHPLRTILSD